MILPTVLHASRLLSWFAVGISVECSLQSFIHTSTEGFASCFDRVEKENIIQKHNEKNARGGNFND